MKLPFDLIVLDLETSSDPDHRITEIGAVRLDRSLAIIDAFEHLVDGRPVTDEIVAITGITNEMLEGQPKFDVVSKRFESWTRKLHDCERICLAVWGAYYDIPVLRREYQRLGQPFPFPGHALDIKSVAWWKMWRDKAIADKATVAMACQHFGVKIEGNEHRALVDARAEAMILQKVMSCE